MLLRVLVAGSRGVEDAGRPLSTSKVVHGSLMGEVKCFVLIPLGNLLPGLP